VTVRACRGDDYACTSPIGKPRDSDANEVVVFELDQSNSEQSYYFEFYLPGSSNPYFIYVPWQPLVGDIALWVPGPIDPAPLYATAEQRSEQPISGRALVAVNVADCVGGNADFLSANPMITFSGPPSILPYYTNRNGAIDAQATGGGFGHFMNVPPGSFSFRVERGESRDLVASAIVPVRADVETRVHFNYPQYY